MDWLLAMTYGAIGGAVVEAVVSSDRVLAWNTARHQALMGSAALRPRPALSAYLDPLSDVAAGVTRILLGAVAGLIFHSQVTGAYAAIAVGCSAPTVLRQLGSARLSAALELEIVPPHVESSHEESAHEERHPAPEPAEAPEAPEEHPSPEPEPDVATATPEEQA